MCNLTRVSDEDFCKRKFTVASFDIYGFMYILDGMKIEGISREEFRCVEEL